MNPAFCTSCGTQIAPGAPACPACVSAVGGPPPAAPGPAAQPRPPQYQATLPPYPPPGPNRPANPQLPTHQTPSYRQPPGGSAKLPKTIFFVLSGLVGLVALAIAGVFVAGLFSNVDGALEKIGMECSPTTEEDWEDVEDPELAGIIKRSHNCEFDDNEYQRVNKGDYDAVLVASLSEIIGSEESVERTLEECADEDSFASGKNAGNLAVGGYVFMAGGSYQIDRLSAALEAEGVASEEAETSCERLAETRR